MDLESVNMVISAIPVWAMTVCAPKQLRYRKARSNVLEIGALGSDT
jgi:hypothetical protein